MFYRLLHKRALPTVRPVQWRWTETTCRVLAGLLEEAYPRRNKSTRGSPTQGVCASPAQGDTERTNIGGGGSAGAVARVTFASVSSSCSTPFCVLSGYHLFAAALKGSSVAGMIALPVNVVVTIPVSKRVSVVAWSWLSVRYFAARFWELVQGPWDDPHLTIESVSQE